MGGVMRQSLASGILVVAVSMLVACGSSEPVSNDVAGGNGNEVDADFHNLKTPPLAAGQFELMTLSTLPDTVTGGDVRMAIRGLAPGERSEEHTSELQSLMRISYAVFCLKKKKRKKHGPAE